MQPIGILRDVARGVVCRSVCSSRGWAVQNGWNDRDAIWGT